MSHGKACENCAAWERLRPALTSTVTQGRCRLSPPSHTGHWPLTAANDWCLGFMSDAAVKAWWVRTQEVKP